MNPTHFPCWQGRKTRRAHSYFCRRRKICQKLNGHASRMWEKNKMDTMLWDCVLEAAIAGDAFLYFYERDGEVVCEQVDTTNVYFGNENERDLQKQPYILIAFRQTVEQVRREASKTACRRTCCARSYRTGNGHPGRRQRQDRGGNRRGRRQVARGAGAFQKDAQDGRRCVVSAKARGMEIQPERDQGHAMYPMAHMAWEPIKGCCRGYGEVRF